jgi:hypothetical protein
MTKDKTRNILVVILIITLFLIWFTWGYFNTVRFNKSVIHSIVIDSSDWQKRSIDYYLKDGNEVNVLNPVNGKIIVGDSISKPTNSCIYRVYRKNNDNIYVFNREYNIEEDY